MSEKTLFGQNGPATWFSRKFQLPASREDKEKREEKRRKVENGEIGPKECGGKKLDWMESKKVKGRKEETKKKGRKREKKKGKGGERKDTKTEQVRDRNGKHKEMNRKGK